MEYDAFRAMNTQVVLAAEGEVEQVEAGFEAARLFIAESERRFTRFSEDSELMQLNRCAGSWFPASPDLFTVLQIARHYTDMTGGLFDPTVLPALRRAGYDRSMEEVQARSPLPFNNDAAEPGQGLAEMRLDAERQQVWLPPGVSLDLGGVAKGWIAEEAACRLARYTDACAVNAGGDLFMIGLPAGQSSWEIELEDPRDPEQSMGNIRVGEGSIATSSVNKRRWQQGEVERHHLIDPRTGEPASGSWLSVTVFAPHAAQAEVFAKAILIGGPAQATSLLRRASQLAFLAVDRQGRLLGSKNYREYFDVSSRKFAKSR